ncbi:uncharacterized protein LOC128735366 [Sabethes cyaneus]|uniref:uncharacterized protein LOC128735366 n=1 Tax=Sabethes cyaneus TaxID=53552 RepID=UPI00237E4F02|nr:uncharacterized protein LOC128735366 [Sabethes cyaneus]
MPVDSLVGVYSVDNKKKPASLNQLNAYNRSSNNHNLLSQGPWANLTHPGVDRFSLQDVSNHSIQTSISNHSIQTSISSYSNQASFYKRTRLDSTYDSYTSDRWNEDPSFRHIRSSTPLISFAQNLSLNENYNHETPLNLIVNKTPKVDSGVQSAPSKVLDLRKKNDSTPIFHQETLETNHKLSEMYQTTQRENCGPLNTTNSGSWIDFTDDEIDPDWVPDGDATLLNNLSIYEYFEKYKNNISDNDSDADAETEETNETEPKSGEPQPKKRKLNLRMQNKILKIKGLPYTKVDGNTVPARQVQPPCSCKMRCYDKFSEPVRKRLLASLLDLTQSGQNQFLSSHIAVIKTVRPKVLISRRALTRIYRLPGVQGAVKVCKRMFMSTFDLRERKVRVLADKLVLGAGIAGDDMRKDNESRKQIDPEHAEYILNHIKSFPAEESHYSREKSSCLYLSSDLTIHRMYELYQDQCGVGNITPVHYNTYRLAFNSLNIKFRKPKVDTCNTCDMIRVELQVEKNTTRRDEILTRREAHQLEAERMYHEKKQDRLRANNDETASDEESTSNVRINIKLSDILEYAAGGTHLEVEGDRVYQSKHLLLVGVQAVYEDGWQTLTVQRDSACNSAGSGMH